jgi:hypothetical protein
MPDSSDRPLTLEEALKEIETLDLPPERKVLLQAELHLVAGGEAKAIETLKSHFPNSSELSQQSKFNFGELTSLDETTAISAEKLSSMIETASLGFCGECTATGGVKGRWKWINPTTKICQPC